jgi:hypothetical protein
MSSRILASFLSIGRGSASSASSKGAGCADCGTTIEAGCKATRCKATRCEAARIWRVAAQFIQRRSRFAISAISRVGLAPLQTQFANRAAGLCARFGEELSLVQRTGHFAAKRTGTIQFVLIDESFGAFDTGNLRSGQGFACLHWRRVVNGRVQRKGNGMCPRLRPGSLRFSD